MPVIEKLSTKMDSLLYTDDIILVAKIQKKIQDPVNKYRDPRNQESANANQRKDDQKVPKDTTIICKSKILEIMTAYVLGNCNN